LRLQLKILVVMQEFIVKNQRIAEEICGKDKFHVKLDPMKKCSDMS